MTNNLEFLSFKKRFSISDLKFRHPKIKKDGVEEITLILSSVLPFVLTLLECPAFYFVYQYNFSFMKPLKYLVLHGSYGNIIYGFLLIVSSSINAYVLFILNTIAIIYGNSISLWFKFLNNR